MTTQHDLELQAKIAELAGRINRHRTGNGGDAAPTSPSPTRHATWQPQRGTPYGTPRGGSWANRAGYRNRTLVVSSPDSSGTTTPGASSLDASKGDDKDGWISKRDRHMQLINTTVYEQKAHQRSKEMEETRLKKQQLREEAEKAKLQGALSAAASSKSSAQQTSPSILPQHVLINGGRYLVTDGGSKLIRVKDDSVHDNPTPKRANVGGVVFVRSRHGNLYRAGLVKTYRKNNIKKVPEPCVQFSTTGSCSKGPMCRFTHDPNKVAICKDFLQTGKCQAGDHCDLSHDPTPERMPPCLHFVRGNCTNEQCRFPHVRVSPASPVCHAFAVYGYCSKGAACADRHVHECPDYANKGLCRNKKCRLPHVDRAGNMRKAAAAQAGEPTEDDDAVGDVTSDDEDWDADSDDVDSDAMEGVLVHSDDSHELSQQVDYVQFSS